MVYITDLMDSHDFSICRGIYQAKREQGCPVIHVTKLGKDFMFAESADGKVGQSGVHACCKWAIKANLADAWFAAVLTPKANKA